MTERSFVAIKPDGVERKLTGEIIKRIEQKGFKMVAMKFIKPSQELAEEHYGEHKEKPFYKGLVEFITSGPVVAMVWEGKDVIATIRKMVGVTDPLKSDPGTIRGDFGISIGRNIIHASDKLESAKKEISLWFSQDELVEYTPTLDKWIYEN
ncbi:nucleoside diphosphate kinase cytosolic [Anaeramoeba ignava]|uniref:nucleoside-diphosphate kinase n=1 Tax=Anaeramoeba ignava TaxID=1746090 RepID=A0A9Q0LNF8_ANAIG|nr:nucleoside diphosphate kinase cytosolic [Anaeramoeba ignava]|eukprot:Anaeramoba_ignava/a615447_206.p1 GENE.a615447_206~~a615447_206.p1  ORF type:complete len:152 (+),score=60.80 a615447_206:106-561(+)